MNATDYVHSGGAYVMKVVTDASGKESGSWVFDANGSWENPGFEQGGDHAVSCVSMTEAEAFCEWLSKKEGRTYRLPTDDEWSAAVGLRKYPWGNEWPAPRGAGNYFGKEAVDLLPGEGWEGAYEYDDSAARTAAVGSYEANRNGFYDLGGNVSEWCKDRYRASMNDPDTLEATPVLKDDSAYEGTPYHVLRGSSWCHVAQTQLRTSYRDKVLPYGCYGYFGFRVVLVGNP